MSKSPVDPEIKLNELARKLKRLESREAARKKWRTRSGSYLLRAVGLVFLGPRLQRSAGNAWDAWMKWFKAGRPSSWPTSETRNLFVAYIASRARWITIGVLLGLVPFFFLVYQTLLLRAQIDRLDDQNSLLEAQNSRLDKQNTLFESQNSLVSRQIEISTPPVVEILPRIGIPAENGENRIRILNSGVSSIKDLSITDNYIRCKGQAPNVTFALGVFSSASAEIYPEMHPGEEIEFTINVEEEFRRRFEDPDWEVCRAVRIRLDYRRSTDSAKFVAIKAYSVAQGGTLFEIGGEGTSASPLLQRLKLLAGEQF